MITVAENGKSCWVECQKCFDKLNLNKRSKTQMAKKIAMIGWRVAYGKWYCPFCFIITDNPPKELDNLYANRSKLKTKMFELQKELGTVNKKINLMTSEILGANIILKEN